MSDKPGIMRFLPPILVGLAILAAGNLIAFRISNIPSRTEVVIFVTLALLIPVIRFPRFGLYYLFLVPPFIPLFRRFYYLLFVRPEQDVLLILSDVVVLFLILAYLDQARKGKAPHTEDRALPALVWWFILYQLLRCFVGNQGTVINALEEFKFVVWYVFCFFFAVYFLEHMRQLRAIFKICAWVGFLTSFYGIKQLYFGFTHFEEIWLDQMRTQFVTLFIEGQARPFSTFTSPACFADYMAISSAAALCLFLTQKGKERFFYLMMIPPMIFALLITSVRSNWVGFLLGAVFWLLLVHRSQVKIKIIALAGVALIAGGISTLIEAKLATADPVAEWATSINSDALREEKKVTDFLVKERLSAVANPFQEHSMLSRFGMWQMVFQNSLIFPQGPLGWGLGAFDAHSYYFSTLFDTGYPGLILLLLILTLFFKAGFRAHSLEEDPERRVYIQALFSIIAAICVMNTTGTHVASHPCDVFFWFSAGALLVIRRLRGEDGRGEKGDDLSYVDPT